MQKESSGKSKVVKVWHLLEGTSMSVVVSEVLTLRRLTLKQLHQECKSYLTRVEKAKNVRKFICESSSHTPFVLLINSTYSMYLFNYCHIALISNVCVCTTVKGKSGSCNVHNHTSLFEP
jgi:hypothetical protein